MSHAIIRTSPKGEKFIGQCTKCGAEGLRMIDIQKPCPCDNIVSDEMAILDVINDYKE